MMNKACRSMPASITCSGRRAQRQGIHYSQGYESVLGNLSLSAVSYTRDHETI
jgi:hypothetical protein